ncbi:MAG: tetratricopeptide repeat protein [Myxococcales bacterium]
MSAGDCRAELVLAERRGKLSSVQRIALGNHLRVCESCRILRSHGSAFDEVEGFEPSDARRLDSMISASERWLEQPRTISRRPASKRASKVVFLAAILFGTAAAATTAGLVVRSSTRVPSTAVATQPVEAPAAHSSIQSSTPNPVGANNATVGDSEMPSNVAQLAPAQAEPRARARSNDPLARPSLTAPQLLQQANSARRSGDSAGAVRLFQKLQQTFPSSREAKLSMVGFGSLLLEQGQSAAALAQFNRYLASSSGQNLTAEALYGKGRALSQLGKSSEERATWAQLIHRFPSSPYVSYARKRLGTAD